MYVVIDIGGTNIRVALSRSLQDPTFTEIRKFYVQNRYTTDIDLIVRTIKELTGGSKLSGIGCCFAGPISDSKQAILGSPNLSDWIGKPFIQDLAQEFRCPVLLENDATCAALGEVHFGHGKGKEFLFLVWGTGLGGTAVTHTADGVQARAMETGHTILEWKSERMCGCGQFGCAEAYVGGINIQKYLGKPAQDLTDDEWATICEYMAHAIINVLATNYNPLVVFGGGIAVSQQERLRDIERVVAERIRIYPAPEIRVTAHGDSIGLVGGLALFARAESTNDSKSSLIPSLFQRHT